MSDQVSKLILLENETQTNSAIERRVHAKKLADAVMDTPSGTPARWLAIWQVWYISERTARQDHVDAIYEAQQEKVKMIDPKYGRTRSTLGLAYGEEGNGNYEQRLVAILPDTLKDWLVKYDSLALKPKVKKDQRKIWRKVYATFPCYRTTTNLDGDY